MLSFFSSVEILGSIKSVYSPMIESFYRTCLSGYKPFLIAKPLNPDTFVGFSLLYLFFVGRLTAKTSSTLAIESS